ncbi:pentapeptide repeat-containing protein [Maridesulfovibrio salexigens]|uniref:Pentapeptide repeat-containing protein n=1 Tax=Maridesulfovibrio salexigens (strain ATCC 14822 / DSM 2638 / NCIMB 8403 / VKM B-1763) TaxID=526222 RepID=C6C206_MARSD|nr:pentapeptide repeat-containing protein [Maridesulfovibrio salexigens]ACS79402.1 hypothetical protein Desal_1340 [Maridesulfovibrio salexigens DSM 2638]
MGCCIGEKHSNWCQDNPTGPSYPPVYIDKEGNEYCIFHAPAECKFVELYDERKGGEKPALMSGEDFNQLVFDRIQGVIDAGEDGKTTGCMWPHWNPLLNFAGTIFIYIIFFQDANVEHFPAMNFKNAVFLQGVSFIQSHFKSDVNFEQARFESLTEFEKSTFHNACNFEHAIFKGLTSFNKAQFKEMAEFTNCQFENHADFPKTNFELHANFENTIFYKDAYFYKSTFKLGINLQNVTFTGDLDFSKSKIEALNLYKAKAEDQAIFEKAEITNSSFELMEFKGPAYFTKSFFSNDVTFKNAIFHNYSNFEQSKFTGITHFINTLFKEWAYFRKVVFKKETTFAGSIAKENILIEDVNLQFFKFINTNIESFKFIECVWGKNKFSPIYDERHKDKLNIKNSSLEEIYRRLKKIARENTDEVQTSAWHYKEKEMMRKRLREENGPGIIEKLSAKICTCLPCDIQKTKDKLAKLITFTEKQRTPFLRLLNSAYWIVSGYGEEPLRAGIWLLIFIFGAMLPAFFGPEVNQATNTLSDFIKGWMWYMPLMKVSDVHAGGWNYLFKALFNVTISIQAALFAFALRNKLRR